MHYEAVQFRNFGYLLTKFTVEQLKPLKDEILKVQSNFKTATPQNNMLAGHIKSEYRLKDSVNYIEQLFLPFIAQYEKQYNYMGKFSFLDRDVPLYLDSLWVNFQKKHEFNPPHTHSGVFSFVIWVEVPYLYEDEKKVFPDVSKGTKNSTGSFCFQYIDCLGGIQSHVINADKTFENTAVIFPADMTHSVHPFYTNDSYRISVSGNFKFKT